MAEDFNELVKLVGELPAMPVVVVKVLKIIDDIDASTKQIAEPISHDPAVSARILGIANSSFYGMRSKVTSLEHAINILGRKTLKVVVLEISLKSVNKGYGNLDRLLWEKSIGCAIAARTLALEFQAADAELSFLGGLFSQIGKMVLAGRYGRDYYQLVLEVAREGKDIAEAEKARFGFDHQAVGAAVLDKWGFAPLLIQSALHKKELDFPADVDETTRRVTAVVNIAEGLCTRLGIGQAAPDDEFDLASCRGLKALGLTADGLEERLESFESVYAQEKEMFAE